jgi:hypothetical protein
MKTKVVIAIILSFHALLIAGGAQVGQYGWGAVPAGPPDGPNRAYDAEAIRLRKAQQWQAFVPIHPWRNYQGTTNYIKKFRC